VNPGARTDGGPGTGVLQGAAYNNKTLTDQIPGDKDLEKGFSSIPDIPQNR
jgi:hypothetical protein